MIPPSPQPEITRTVPDNVYFSQPGDTFVSVSARFGGFPLDFGCLVPDLDACPASAAGEAGPVGFDPNRLLPIGTALLIPAYLDHFGHALRLIPDSEVVFTYAASDFDLEGYVDSAGGFLATHRQYLMMNAWNSAAEVVGLVAEENSANPLLLLALLEYQCGCVLGPTESPEPYLGADFILRPDLYGQLVWAVHELSNGYYGWRQGTLTEVVLQDGARVRLNPRLNAGTAALYRLFAALFDTAGFHQALDPADGFPATFAAMFGDPWAREVLTIPDGSAQPLLRLPFEPGQIWSYTGGPHPAFERNGPLAALDFAPASAEPGCQPTPAWVVAAADGLVVRSEFGLLVQDLDGDGDENTGWAIMYLHVGEAGRTPEGVYLKAGERLGQPACEGGRTNGTHLHIARKLNGEWIPAGSGPLPFALGGWIAADGSESYQGTLARDGVILIACECSWRAGWIADD
jgi:murein DD-endopeptidase MepM/ murein hydrolase activator NlpD